jgi:hypothetical protein
MRTFIIALVAAVGFASSASAQCDTIATICAQKITADFISDGQSYRALLNGDEVAEFRATFYGGSTYRIAGCSGFTDGNLIFSLFDEEHNRLFTSSDHKNTPYWDFKFTSTVDCIIEARLNTVNVKSGCAVMVIGFK